MKQFRILLIYLILGCFLITGCGKQDLPAESETEIGSVEPSEEVEIEIVDHAGSVKLNMNSSTIKQEVTVKTFVDGDTTHFNVPESIMPDGIFKARYLAINTPESTGKIEEYGKAASNFTKEKLSAATSIIIESETDSWDPDSTGGRYLVWVWYKTEGMKEYRNLNIEILQNGLALANSAGRNQYGDTCLAAIAQAKYQKLNMYSGQKDPDFYYGEAVELTLKELRANIENYKDIKVAFSGIISANSGTQGIYVEDYDPETDMYYGMYIYYGHNLSGTGLDILSVGNEVRIVGSVQYYEGGDSWQVSDLTYRMMKPDDPNNIQKLSEGHSASFKLTEADTFVNEEVTVQLEEKAVTLPYAQMALGTSVEMKGLKVVEVYTTDNPDSSSDGAMTLTCECDGVTVTVRTIVLLDEDGNRITADAYEGKTIDVKGIVDSFDGEYQIKVFSAKNILIN
ncbi:MAG: thermonuclease family protein [Lachnospiraceae bacterium]|nr:thermonuclease family protein [Lachnospiraceae bacterium]